MLRLKERKGERGEVRGLEKKGRRLAPRDKSIQCCQINPASGGRSGLRSASLLHFLYFVHQIVGLLLQRSALVRALDGVSFAAIEEVEVSHGVIVIGPQRNGLLQVGNAFVYERSVFREIVAANGRGKRIGVLNLLANILFVVILAHLAVRAESQSPVNHGDPVIGFRILRFELNVLLMVGLGFLEKLGIVRSARHLKEDGADAVNGAEIIGVGLENFLKFCDGLFADILILLGGGARNVLTGIGGGEIETGVEERGIEILGLLEVLNRGIVLAVFESSNAFVKEIARLEFVAAGETDGANQQRQESRSPAKRKCGRASVRACKRCMSHRSVHPYGAQPVKGLRENSDPPCAGYSITISAVVPVPESTSRPKFPSRAIGQWPGQQERTLQEPRRE